jgi:hypothetical protein
MNEEIEQVKKELQIIHDRNRRVEADKAWETSSFRVLAITLITYLIAALFLYFVGVENFYLSALVPAIGYFLSMRSLPAVKRWWVRRMYSKRAR